MKRLRGCRLKLNRQARKPFILYRAAIWPVVEGVQSMRRVRWLTALPFLGMLIGPYFLNRVEPFILGLPFLLAWLVICVLTTSVVMAIVYVTDPQNRVPEDGR
ncbi:hypothetical protein KHHGKMAE_3016 [Methylobacterium persicinum]|nr:hypothetical protein KHHGKMAE_3016 [Methylobacterium persicinum]